MPLIAETGGINAMVVDSSALPEQVVDAVVQSAFRSAGQRCSALRLLCVHEGIADDVIEMIRGARAELRVGDPALLATDVGPVIDARGLRRHPAPPAAPERAKPRVLVAPRRGRAARAATWSRRTPSRSPPSPSVKSEIFGPVLHVVRWSRRARRP